MTHHAFNASGFLESDRKVSSELQLEKRRYTRVAIVVPISCVSVDSESRPLDQNKGIIKNVSQTGARIDAENNICSDRLKLTLVAFNQNLAEITAKTLYSRKSLSGTYEIGVQFQGNKPDIIKFVIKAVKLYHYTKK